MKCKICNKKSQEIFTKKLLEKYDVKYFKCQSCSFVQTEAPHWLEEAYESSINLTDTGYIARNLLFRETLKYFLKFKFSHNDQFLDFGAGYGVFPRMMRDLNFDFYWSDEFTSNLFSRGFEKSVEDSSFAAITMFEVAEHLVNPLDEFKLLAEHTGNIIFSTELAPANIQTLESWWYLGCEHGQHVSIWSDTSIAKLADILGMHKFSKGSLHFLTKTKLTPFQKIVLTASSFLYRAEKKFFGSRTWSDNQALK